MGSEPGVALGKCGEVRCFHLLHYHTDFCFFEEWKNFRVFWKNVSGVAVTVWEWMQ